jgi:hypothetical protein
MLSSNGAFAASSESNSASGSLEDDVKVHTEDTSEGIIFHSEVNMFLDTESEASCIRKVLFFELTILNFESTLEDFVGLVTSDSDVNGDLLISLDGEASNGVTGARWDGFLSSKVLKNLACFIIRVVPLVSLSPDSPTLMFKTSFSMRTSLIGFSFSAYGFLATFLLIDGYKYSE